MFKRPREVSSLGDGRVAQSDLLDTVLARLSPTEANTLLLAAAPLIENDEDLTDVLRPYLTNVEEQHVPRSTPLTSQCCSNCGYALNVTPGFCTCSACGAQFSSVSHHMDFVGFAHQVSKKVSTPYSRFSHYKEFLYRLQGLQRSTLPPHVLALMRNEALKRKLHRPTLTYTECRELLGAYRLYKYYPHVPLLRILLGGPAPPGLALHEKQLHTLFKQVLNAFEEVIPHKSRRYFLSYAFVTRRLFEILHIDPNPFYLPQYKTFEKRVQQDEQWSAICKTLHWPFLPNA